MTTGYYRHPTIHRDRIVFVSEDDLWEVDVAGGQARRLTANPGPSTFPSISPGGDTVAYVGRDEGETEVYVLDGTERPRRLTFQGALAQVVGWDGEDIVYASNAEWPFSNDMRLWSVRAGASAWLLPWGPARALARQPGGPGVVIGRQTADPARWKRYRGGRAGALWVDVKGIGTFQPLVSLDGNLAHPMWIGSRIYFVSDHEGHGNVYSVTPTGRSLKRHTDHEDFYARHASTDGRRIVYQHGAGIRLLDPEGESAAVPIEIASARAHRNRKFVAAGRFLESLDLHPAGHSIAATVRGGSYTMPLWEGAVRRHGQISSVRRQLTAWLPDGERIISVTDESGEERLVVESVADGERTLIKTDVGRIRSIDVAPAGSDRVVVTNDRHEVVVVTLSTGNARVLHRSNFSWPAGAAWSVDGRWLAFSGADSRTSHSLYLWDSRTRRAPVAVTGTDFYDVWPSFDPQGSYLYFTSIREFDPVTDLHFHEYSFPNAARPYLIALRKNVASPFESTGRAPRAPGAPLNGGTGDETVEVQIDLDGISDRVVGFPKPPGRYGRLVGAKGRVFVISHPIRGALGVDEDPTGVVEAWDFTTEKFEQVASGVTSISSNPTGTVLALRSRHRVRVVAVGWKEDKSAGSEPSRASGWLDMTRLRVQVDPGAEWAQMLADAWRLQRDHFWRESMSGVDWPGVYSRYQPLVDRVGARSEFSDLMWEMQGELGTSHAYEMGGEYRPSPTYPQGTLGAELTFQRGAWKIASILKGDPWDPAATSPLGLAGVDAAVGDRIVAIDGIPVGADVTPAALLVDRGGRSVSITLKRGRRSPHEISVKPLSDESSLRYRLWVQGNRAAVAAATDGRAGYIHIPDMQAKGFAEFHRALATEIDKEGLVIDVRYNRGGNVSQLLLEKLARRRVGWNVPRWRAPVATPYDAPSGPMVALTNEMSGSDGDIFSHTFKLAGLGPLIGTRTWGGVVGIWPQHALVDGTVTTQPEFAHWFVDVGFAVENYGTDPDIEVHNAPQDYATGLDPQLERGVVELLSIMDANESRLPETDSLPSLAAPRLPGVER